MSNANYRSKYTSNEGQTHRHALPQVTARGPHALPDQPSSMVIKFYYNVHHTTSNNFHNYG